MRPTGVSIIAAFSWLMGAIWALAGLSVIGFTHVGGRLLARLTDANVLQRLTSGLGAAVGAILLLTALVYVVVGFGLWNLKNWARILTLFFVGVALSIGLRGLIEYHHLGRVVRSAIDASILIYLMLPDVSRVFARR
jgi:uncharacterized membrane protein (DUF2068 family)